jgi:hypothetical protein
MTSTDENQVRAILRTLLTSTAAACWFTAGSSPVKLRLAWTTATWRVRL